MRNGWKMGAKAEWFLKGELFVIVCLYVLLQVDNVMERVYGRTKAVKGAGTTRVDGTFVSSVVGLEGRDCGRG